MRLSTNAKRMVALAAVAATGWAGPAVEAAVWVGGATGTWATDANWDTASVPDTASEDVRIDNNTGQNTTVTHSLAGGTPVVSIGTLTIDAGDTLSYTGTGTGSTGLSNAGMANAGTLSVSISAGGNVASNTFTTAGTGQIFNAGGATLNVRNTSGRNRINLNFDLAADNQNNGTMLVYVSGSDRNTSQLRLAGTGTFTNNGVITLQYNNSAESSSSNAAIRLQSNGAVTLGGTGMIVMDQGATGSEEVQIIGTNTASVVTTLTHGAAHTISGAGGIGANTNLTNDGLITSTTAGKTLTINPFSSVTNSASGRLVAAGTSTLIIGATGDTFTNNGLLEARSGAGVTLGATTLAINGQVRGDGTITAPALALGDTASLLPGDSASDNGTGASTVGGLTVAGALSLAEQTVLDFQLGAASIANAGITYDTVDVSGDLTLNGVLNIAALPGFGEGVYRLFSFSGTLTDQGLTLPDPLPGLSYSLTDGSSGHIDLVVVPEPAAIALLGLAGIATLRRRR